MKQYINAITMKSKIIYLLIFSLSIWACEKDIVLESLNSEKLHRVHKTT